MQISNFKNINYNINRKEKLSTIGEILLMHILPQIKKLFIEYIPTIAFMALNLMILDDQNTFIMIGLIC